MRLFEVKVLLFAVAFGAITTAPAQAATLIDQNFDDTGVFVAGSKLNFTGVGNANATGGFWSAVGTAGFPGALVSSTQSVSPSQSLASARDPGYETGQFIGYVNVAVSSGMAEVTVSARRNTAGSGAEFSGSGVNFLVGNKTNFNAVVGTLYGNIGFAAHTDNKLYVFHNGLWALTTISVLDTPGGSGIWHDYKMVIDLDNNTYDLYLDAALVYNDAIFDLVLVGSLNAVRTVNQFTNAVASEVWFDDVVLSDGSGPFVCGDPGTVYDPYDFNQDCQVDALDLAEIGLLWLKCTDPANSNCDQYWM